MSVCMYLCVYPFFLFSRGIHFLFESCLSHTFVCGTRLNNISFHLHYVHFLDSVDTLVAFGGGGEVDDVW